MSIAFSGSGTALVLAMLTQTLNPVWNTYGATGQTLPAAVNVIDDQPLKNTSGAFTVANDVSSFNSPVKVVNTPTAATISGSQASVTYTGTDHQDRVISERLVWTPTAPTAEMTTKLWYKTITGSTSQGWEEAASKKLTATAQDRSVEVIFIPNDLILRRFWTIMLSKGIVPNRYYGCILNEATMEVTNEAFMALTCSFLGRKADLYTNLAGDTGPTARADSKAALSEASAEVFSGPQTKLFGEGGIELSMQDTTVSFAQELEYANTYGQRFQASSPGRSTKRLVQFDGQGLYAPENNMSSYFENNQTMRDVRLQMKEDGVGAYPYEATLEGDEGQFTADPDPAVSDEGIILQNLIFKLVTSGGKTSEYQWRCRYPEYDQVRIYTQ